MKRLTGIFVLSKSEQRVIVIVILALLVGALVQHERRVNQLPLHASPVATPGPRPSLDETAAGDAN
jgi:hypothetical protein